MRSLAVILEEMEQVSKNGGADAEAAHSDADKLLVETIRVLSARLAPSQRAASEEIIQYWNDCPKWYA